MFEDVRHERLLILLLSLTDPDPYEKTEQREWSRNNLNKNSCFKKFPHTGNFCQVLKEYAAVSLKK